MSEAPEATMSLADELRAVASWDIFTDAEECEEQVTECRGTMDAAANAMDEMLAALHAVMRCARGELERPVTQRQPWGEAQRLIEAAIAKAEGRDNG